MLLTLDEWIARNAIAFAPDHAETLNAAVDELVATLDHSVGVLGFGEPMHGAEEFLELRNRFFQRLVEAHGYTAIAIESSFTKGRIVDDYVAGRRGTSYDAIQDHGFSHGFGASAANRALVEWMRKYNSEPKHRAKLRFWGFDSPTEMVGTDSPRQLLAVSLDYLDTTAGPYDTDRRHRIDELLGSDAPWEDPAASFDPAKAIGLSDAATALRIETEDLISELTIRRPELISASDADRYADAVRSANFARQMLNYHAGLAKNNSRRLVDLLGMRDVMMADNLV
ncbi:MAG TPA: erythromycin esterase family protein, partial [Pirellulales bacterium]|nr:erythromycin esterase family protein [Pirellulales bacterium]